MRTVKGYQVSRYTPDAQPGEVRDGVRCEDLMRLSYPSDSFDLVITSDVFEHVREPRLGFAEVFRVLRPGGADIFTIPVDWPMRAHTVPRVDVSGDEDVLLLEPEYHGASLVYNDFGADVLDLLDEIGFDTEPVWQPSDLPALNRLVAFRSVKPAS